MFIVGVLVTLSLVLTAAVLFPDIGSGRIEAILGVGAALAAISVATFAAVRPRLPPRDRTELQLARIAWKTPGLNSLGAIKLTRCGGSACSCCGRTWWWPSPWSLHG